MEELNSRTTMSEDPEAFYLINHESMYSKVC